MAIKHTRGKKKNNHSIVRILVLGLIVLAVSMTICFIHTADVRQCFEKMMVQQTYKDVQHVASAVSDEMGKTLEILEQGSVYAMTEETKLDKEGIMQLLSQLGTMDEFDAVLFVEDSGKVYQNREEVTEADSADLLTLSKITKPAIFTRNVGNTAETGQVYYVVPIFDDAGKVGQFIGVRSATGVLTLESFADVEETGDVFLINKSGQIIGQDADQFVGEDTDLFANLSEMSADMHSRSRVIRLSQTLANKDYGKTYFVDNDGMTNYIEFRKISSAANLFVAYVFPETVYTSTVMPVVFKTLLVCIIIAAVTIAVLFYMWALSKQANDRIEALAYEDPVTGGKNDNYFRNVAASAIWENISVPYVVVRFDIANFRYINEAYGHARADELLTAIIQESQKLFNGKEICVRINSDQFVMLARNDREFDGKCEELITAVNARARAAGIMFPIRLKRGIYAVRRDDTDISIIIDRANVARKSISADEKVLVATYSDKIVQQMYVEEKIESEMDEAMRTGEFKVYIQPKWDIVNDCIYGGEALVRWIKRDGSVVYPDQFIPVFERNGYIEKLDLYMLEEVCKYQRILMDENKTIYPISVNQSRILLHNPDYLNQISKIMKRYRIPNGYVELEVTETVFLDERNLMIQTTNELKKMEVALSMDDFGSGYSSLNMLKDVPFDVIKIDREFFSESITTNSSIWILRKIVEMAEGLGIRVLCEGVETADQVEILKNIGCQYVQGYYYSKPIESNEFIKKYCVEKENGKEYYNQLYASQAAARAQRNLSAAEAVTAQSASSAVEKFKKTYVPKNEEKSEVVVDESGKVLSAEEQKILASEAKHGAETKLSEDAQ